MEFLHAGFAAELYLLSLVNFADGRAHRSEFVAADNAGFGRVGLCCCAMRDAVLVRRCARTDKPREDGNCDDMASSFHGVVLLLFILSIYCWGDA